MVPGSWVTLAVKDDWPGAVISNGFDGINAFKRSDATEESKVLSRLVAWFPIV